MGRKFPPPLKCWQCYITSSSRKVLTRIRSNFQVNILPYTQKESCSQLCTTGAWYPHRYLTSGEMPSSLILVISNMVYCLAKLLCNSVKLELYWSSFVVSTPKWLANQSISVICWVYSCFASWNFFNFCSKSQGRGIGKTTKSLHSTTIPSVNQASVTLLEPHITRNLDINMSKYEVNVALLWNQSFHQSSNSIEYVLNFLTHALYKQL